MNTVRFSTVENLRAPVSFNGFNFGEISVCGNDFILSATSEHLESATEKKISKPIFSAESYDDTQCQAQTREKIEEKIGPSYKKKVS